MAWLPWVGPWEQTAAGPRLSPSQVCCRGVEDLSLPASTLGGGTCTLMPESFLEEVSRRGRPELSLGLVRRCWPVLA